MRAILAIAAAFTLSVAPALAQSPHADHKSDAAAPPGQTPEMTPEEKHKHCAPATDPKLQGQSQHERSVEKPGRQPSAATPPTEAEMKAMHETCAATMAPDKKP